MKIYLDVCCLNRPFDDQTQDRIRLESEAIISIFSHHENKSWEIIGSDIITFEVNQIPNPSRKEKVQNISKNLHPQVKINQKITIRAKELELLNIKALDALHISTAENAGADVFLTTDDKLIKIYRKHPNLFFITIRNPLNWITEMI